MGATEALVGDTSATSTVETIGGDAEAVTDKCATSTVLVDTRVVAMAVVTDVGDEKVRWQALVSIPYKTKERKKRTNKKKNQGKMTTNL